MSASSKTTIRDTTPRAVVVLGAGQAAVSAIATLRQSGYEGSITLVGEEPFLPYQRPPLSKAYLKGELAEERLYFKPSSWYRDNDIELLLSTRANDIDRAARQVALEHGGYLDYDALVIATGSRARKLNLPGVGLDNVFDLRSLTDVERIRPKMIDGLDVVVVGAGYIGLEAAAVARKMGLNVTVLEYAPRALSRVTSRLVSEFYEKEHRSQGVDIRPGSRLEELVGENGRVSGARMRDGSVLHADVVLVGIGIVPNEELASASGLQCDNGIVVDRDARTGDPNIYAAGDCSNRPLVHYGRHGRLESVHNAIEQGKLAAAAILGKPRPVEDCPWFWSDQYDIKLQIAGLSAGFDEFVVRSDPGSRRFAVFYLKDSKLIAADAVNAPQEFVSSKRLIVSRPEVDRAALADPTVPMKQLSLGPGSPPQQ